MRPACQQCEVLRANHRSAIMSFVRAANRYGVSVLLHGSTTRQEFATRFRKADWLREEARHQLSAHESAHARERALALSA